MGSEPGAWPLGHLCFPALGPASGHSLDFVVLSVLAVEVSVKSFKVVSQLPWGRTLNVQPCCPHHAITSFGGEGASGLIHWRFVSVDWNWNLPNHSLVFSVRVILVHVKPQPGFCLEPVTLWLLPPLELSLVFACCTGQRPAARPSVGQERRE